MNQTSDGQTISVLEEFLGEKKVKRGFCEKYLWCCFGKRVRFK
tara:strand:+ start:323 stop:451 length:129 start_codon:yes stop_codon:yes gene_type:complete